MLSFFELMYIIHMQVIITIVLFTYMEAKSLFNVSLSVDFRGNFSLLQGGENRRVPLRHARLSRHSKTEN